MTTPKVRHTTSSRSPLTAIDMSNKTALAPPTRQNGNATHRNHQQHVYHQNASRRHSLELKLLALERVDRGERVTSIARDLGLNESTIRGFRKRADAIKSYAMSMMSNMQHAESANTRETTTRCRLDTAIRQQQLAVGPGGGGNDSENNEAGGNVLREATLTSIGIAVGENGVSNVARDMVNAGIDVKQDLTASSVGAPIAVEDNVSVEPETDIDAEAAAPAEQDENDDQDHPFRQSLQHREEAGSNSVPDESHSTTDPLHTDNAQFQAQLTDNIRLYNYTPKQVFNICSSGLYWKNLPHNLASHLSNVQLQKPADHVTVLVGANVAGSHKLKPVVIHHSKDQEALDGYISGFLPVHLYCSASTLPNSDIIIDYVSNRLHAELELYCRQEGLPFQCLLLLEEDTHHSPTLLDMSDNIRVMFIPAATDPTCTPLCQDIIPLLRLNYLRCRLHALLPSYTKLTRDITSVDQVTIKDAIIWLSDAWSAITPQCLNYAWIELCKDFAERPDTITNKNIVQVTISTIQEILVLAKALRFTTLEVNNIEEYVVSHKQPLSDRTVQQLITEHKRHSSSTSNVTSSSATATLRNLPVEKLREALCHIDYALSVLDAHDPNLDRSARAGRRVRDSIAFYTNMLRDQLYRQPTTTQQQQQQQAAPATCERRSCEDGVATNGTDSEPAGHPPSGPPAKRLRTSD